MHCFNFAFYFIAFFCVYTKSLFSVIPVDKGDEKFKVKLYGVGSVEKEDVLVSCPPEDR